MENHKKSLTNTPLDELFYHLEGILNEKKEGEEAPEKAGKEPKGKLYKPTKFKGKFLEKGMSDSEIERDQADREKDEEDAEDEEEAKTGQAVEGLYGPSRDATHSQAMKDVEDIGKKAKNKAPLSDKDKDDQERMRKRGAEIRRSKGPAKATWQDEMAEPGQVVNASKKNGKKDGDWIQKAVNPKHKGYCTPMTKSTCTPARKALAKRFKKAAKKEKSQGGTGWQGKV